MINFKTTTTEINQNTDELLSRLTWQIHSTNNLLFPKTNTFTADTTRPLIGKLEVDKNKFDITRLRPILQTFLPQIFASGQLKNHNGKTIVTIKYRLGLFSFAFFLFIFYATASSILKILTTSATAEMYVDVFMFIIIFPVTGIILAFWEINKTKDKIFNILDIEN
ncbi:MAG: hypothetical protein HXX16_18660 [Bacteroidales bacterium]|nr:hypothetical protein [Bacteroidales bacterium]